MTNPQLTFFCELESDALINLFTDTSVLSDIRELNARVSLGIIDFNSERVHVVKELNKAGVPVIAWLLLPKDQGYWFNINNAPQAVDLYEQFIDWTEENELEWSGIGFDIEIDYREMALISDNWLRILPIALKRLFDINRLKIIEGIYRSLKERFQARGYTVESYQFPWIIDERRTGSSLLRRISGTFDVHVDREVWMLYTHFLRPHGAGFLTSYAPEAHAIGIGSTGGGVDLVFVDSQPLNWQEFARDLRLAWYWCDEIYIFSLEGCVSQGFLKRLKSFAWDQPIMLPDSGSSRVDSVRSLLRSTLWFGAHIHWLILGLFGLILAYFGLRQLINRDK